MSPLQLALYRSFQASDAVQRALKGAGGGGDKQQQLAPLVAINCLKKLCCHPDMIYQQFGAPAAAAAAGGRGLSGGAAATAGRARTSSAAAASGGATSGKGGRNAPSLTGFENCLPCFSGPGVYPAYQPDACQPLHSGKVRQLPCLAGIAGLFRVLFVPLLCFRQTVILPSVRVNDPFCPPAYTSFPAARHCTAHCTVRCTTALHALYYCR